MYKLIAFTPSDDLYMQSYVENQLQATVKLYPDLVVEHVNETDDRLKLYVRNPNRFPAFLITKNNVRKTSMNAKLDTQQFIDWVSSNLG